MGTPGGLPLGRVIEIRGKFGSSKSTLCAMILAQAQADGMLGVLCDTEFSYTGDWLRKYGCNIETLVRLTPDHAQMFFDEVGICIKSVKESKLPVPIVIICDTISNLPPYEELQREDSTEGIQAAALAKAISTGLRKLSNMIFMQDVALIFVSQLKVNPRASFGDKESVIGGGAIELLSSIRIKMARTANLKVGEGPVFGQKNQIQVTKNKLAMPWRTMTFDLDFVHGVNNYAIAMEFMLQLGEIKRIKNHYELDGKELGGKKEVISYLESQGPPLLAGLYDQLGLSGKEASPLAFIEQGPAMFTSDEQEIAEAEVVPNVELLED